MQEIWIPELLITLFLFLHIIQPYIKKFGNIDGLAWLPLVSFLLALALVPAYGFRPEVFPLLLYAAVLTVISIFGQRRLSERFRNYREIKLFFVFPPLIFLAATAGTAFYFTPQKDTALSTQGVYAQRLTTVNAGDRGETEYLIRVYTDEDDNRPSRRPLLILLSPALGSLLAVDMVSAELRDRGFTVVAFSESYGTNLAEWFYRFHSFFSGTVSAKANTRGRRLEEKRKEDILFILSWVRQNPRLEGRTPLFDIASRDAVFLAGYDAGGSALVLLENTLSAMRVRGLIAIESPLWSLYREEENERAPLSVDAGWYESVRYGLNSWLIEVKPKKIIGPGRIPELSLPILFLVSERSRESEYSEGQYLALFKTFKAARGFTAMASADGAGPLDYSDFPVKYPFITTLFHGSWKPDRNTLAAPAVTAAIITRFAAGFLEAEDGMSSRLNDVPIPAGVRITQP